MKTGKPLKLFLLLMVLSINIFAFVTIYGDKFVQIGSETTADVITVDPKTNRANISVGVQINDGIVIMTDNYETHNFYVKNGKYLAGSYVYDIENASKLVTLLKKHYKLMVTFPKKTGGVASMTFDCTGFTKAYNKILSK